jgi:hypothetical protein
MVPIVPYKIRLRKGKLLFNKFHRRLNMMALKIGTQVFNKLMLNSTAFGIYEFGLFLRGGELF